MPSKKSKSDNGDENFLVVVKGKQGYYAAGPAWKLPADFVDALDTFKPRAGDAVTVSKRALIVQLDDAKIPTRDWVAYNLRIPPGPPPLPLTGHKRKP